MDIKSADFVISNTDYRKCPDSQLPEFAFIGRSNVGKSSLINMLCNRHGLAMTSSKPGKTLLINHFLVNNNWHLVDLPGYGYASTGKKMRDQLKEIIESYILYREQLTCLFVLIDSRHEPQQIDLDFMEWLGENGIPFSIIFTKLDKLTFAKGKSYTQAYQVKLSETWEELPPIFMTSSEKRLGRDDVLGYIGDVIKSLNIKPNAGHQSPN
jgi:GTP-binding protein